MDVCKDIKERFCYVSNDYMQDTKIFMNSNDKNEEYDLPDGT